MGVMDQQAAPTDSLPNGNVTKAIECTEKMQMMTILTLCMTPFCHLIHSIAQIPGTFN